MSCTTQQVSRAEAAPSFLLGIICHAICMAEGFYTTTYGSAATLSPPAHSLSQHSVIECEMKDYMYCYRPLAVSLTMHCWWSLPCTLLIPSWPSAALGHQDVLKAVVEVLQSSAADVAGCQGLENIKEPSINMLTWGRFVKDVINARTSAGKTPLMLACEKGCANLPTLMNFMRTAGVAHLAHFLKAVVPA